MEKINIDELKELMRLAFNSGVSTGKKMLPMNEIPMGSKITMPNASFEIFFSDFCEKLKKEVASYKENCPFHYCDSNPPCKGKCRYSD